MISMDYSKRILCVGDICPDMVVPYGAMKNRLREVEKKGCDGAPSPDITFYQGGSVGNTAAILGKLGMNPLFVGKLGNCNYSVFLENELSRQGVDVRYMAHEDASVQVVVGVIDEHGERTMFMSKPPGSRFLGLYPEDIPDELISKAAVVHSSGMSLIDDGDECRTMADFYERSRRLGVVTCFDLNMRAESFGMGDVRRGCYERIIDNCDIILGSSIDEFLPLTGIADLHDSAKALADKNNIVVARDGKNNVLVFDHKKEFCVTPDEVKVVSKIGAGDAFNAGFVESLFKGRTVKEAVVRGNELACYLISHTAHHAVPKK